MEPITYFTDRQKLVLAHLWKICIIYAILKSIVIKLPDFDIIPLTARSSISFVYIVDNLLFGLLFCWEYIVWRDVKKVFLIALFYLCSIILYTSWHTTFSQVILLNFEHYIYLGFSCLQFTIIYLIAGKPSWWKLGPMVAILLFYTIEMLHTPWDGRISHFVRDLITPLLIYGWLYLTENRFKPTPGDKQEYQFLLVLLIPSACYVIMESYALNVFDAWPQQRGQYLFEIPNIIASQVLFIFTLHLLHQVIIGKNCTPRRPSVVWSLRGMLLLGFLRAVLLLAHANFRGLFLFMIMVIVYYAVKDKR